MSKAAFDQVGAQGAGGGEAGVEDAGAQVGVEAELLAQGQQRAALRAQVRVGDSVVLGAADRAEVDGVGALGEGQRLRRQGVAGGVVGRAADERFVQIQVEVVLLGGGLQDLDAFVHDLRADAVSRQDGNGGHGVFSPSFKEPLRLAEARHLPVPERMLPGCQGFASWQHPLPQGPSRAPVLEVASLRRAGGVRVINRCAGCAGSP